MAFGFFKKTISADLVLHNGIILTQDADNPEVSAVACTGGKITAVGSYESMEHLIGGNTQVIDLEGKYLVPGLISLFDKPVMNIFEGKYADLTDCKSQQDLVTVMKDWADSHPDSEVLFGFGYNEGLFGEEYTDNIHEVANLLDQCCDDKPMVLLAKNNITCLLNTYGINFVAQTAEEEMVEYITVPYILNLLIPFDFEVLETEIARQIDKKIKHGITSSLNLDSPEYFETFYQDALIGLYNENSLKQRFFGSYYMNRPVMTKALIHRLMNRKNTCIELDGFISANILYIDLDMDSCPVEFTQDMLNTIVEEVADKGFDIIVKAAAYKDMEMAYLACDYMRAKGYKGLFAIQTEHSPSEELAGNLMSMESVRVLDTHLTPGQTGESAEIIKMSGCLGSIEAGKLADMAVFEENPFDAEPYSYEKLEAVITILNGEIIN